MAIYIEKISYLYVLANNRRILTLFECIPQIFKVCCVQCMCACAFNRVYNYQGFTLTLNYSDKAEMVWRSARARNLLNSSSTSSGQLIIDNVYNSSEQDSSEGEFVEAEKPWPPVELSRSSRARTKVAALHVPRPHSHLFRRPDGRSRGSKHSRRWENCKT